MGRVSPAPTDCDRRCVNTCRSCSPNEVKVAQHVAVHVRMCAAMNPPRHKTGTEGISSTDGVNDVDIGNNYMG
jgi:hypothetical protein